MMLHAGDSAPLFSAIKTQPHGGLTTMPGTGLDCQPPVSSYYHQYSHDHAGKRRNLDGRSVLLVEDEMFIALDIELAIEDLGGRVVGPVQTLSEALELAQDATFFDTFDCAILDINLHGEEVFPFATVLRERNVPFLFHTGHGIQGNAVDAWKDVPVLRKPVMPNHMLDILGSLLG